LILKDTYFVAQEEEEQDRDAAVRKRKAGAELPHLNVVIYSVTYTGE
jgi:hypothetical protein